MFFREDSPESSSNISSNEDETDIETLGDHWIEMFQMDFMNYNHLFLLTRINIDLFSSLSTTQYSVYFWQFIIKNVPFDSEIVIQTINQQISIRMIGNSNSDWNLLIYQTVKENPVNQMFLLEPLRTKKAIA
ncbi:hypothetical protein EDC94DRAFT_583875 [Helicostylum pulchrum]|nr:hypothetical protein EDC94DRAFT_583875 [Helicostylum pulchrum]